MGEKNFSEKENETGYWQKEKKLIIIGCR